jgi:hypothetical protein
MRGFEGSPDHVAHLRVALDAVDAVFPPYAEEGVIDPWGVVYPEDLVAPRRVDGIVRAWKKRRLELPLEALGGFGTTANAVFVRYSLRRFAFFVPTLLAAWTAPSGVVETSWLCGLVGAARHDEELVRHEATRTWTGDELSALETFFDAALAAALGTDIVAPDAELDVVAAVMRQLRLGSVDRGSTRRAVASVDVAEDVLLVAAAFGLSSERLVDAWFRAAEPFAEKHLLLAAAAGRELPDPPWDDTNRARLADRVAQAFFAARESNDVERLSLVEQRVRRG